MDIKLILALTIQHKRNLVSNKQLLMDTKPTGQKEKLLRPTWSFSERRERKEVIWCPTPEELRTPRQQKASSCSIST